MRRSVGCRYLKSVAKPSLPLKASRLLFPDWKAKREKDTCG